MAASAGQGKQGSGPIKPLAHPVRRRILRYMHETGDRVGTPQVAEGLELRLPLVKYHVLTLAKFELIAQVDVASDGVSPIYESTVSGDAKVLAELERTQEEDEGRQRKAA